jgi:hypothetical protein
MNEDINYKKVIYNYLYKIYINLKYSFFFKNFINFL